MVGMIRRSEIAQLAKEQRILHQTLYRFEQEARKRERAAFWQATLHPDKLTKIAGKVGCHVVYLSCNRFESDEIRLMNL